MKKLLIVPILSVLVILTVIINYKSRILEIISTQPELRVDLEGQPNQTTHSLKNEASHFSETILIADEIISRPAMNVILREYCSTLLTEYSQQDTPSCRVDKILESRHLVNLDVNEAGEYLETLLTMPEEYEDDIQIYASFLITQIASSDAEKAIGLLTTSEFEYEDETSENALRLWMVKDGEGVLDWFEKIDNPELASEFAGPLFTVYAEEDPYGLLMRYSEHEDIGYSLRSAVRNLYDDYGNEVYDFFLADNFPKKTLEESFQTIAHSKLNQNPETARAWIMDKRYTVDTGVSSKMAEDIISRDNPWRPSNLSKTLKWAMENQLLKPDNELVKEQMKRLLSRDPNGAKQLIENLQLKLGPSMNPLNELLINQAEDVEDIFEHSPFSIDEDESGYLTSNTISCGIINSNIKDLHFDINILTEEFLEGI